MRSEWPSVPLRDLCDEVQYGFTASSAAEPVGPKFLRITDIVPDVVAWSNVPYCEIDPAKLGKYQLSTGDIVVARTGATVGYAKLIRQPPLSVFASYLVRFRVSEAHDARYVGAVVESDSYKEYVRAHAGGAAQPNANAQVLGSFPVPLPRIEIQRKIAAVLAAYDELIENNRRRIATLEKMAQAVYQEWFINLRIPGHEDVARVDSPIGSIPARWDIAAVSDAIELNPRIRLPRDEAIRFVPMGSLAEGSMVIEGIETRTSPSGSQFRNGDILLARITPSLENGKTGFVQLLSEDEVACGSTEFIVMRSRSLTPEFVYLLARTDDFRGVAIKSMVGASGRQRVRENSIANYSFAHPDRSTLDRFHEMVSPMFRMVQSLVDQNAVLRVTRDLLLPKLVSGDIDVSDLDIDTEWLAS